MPAAKLAPNTNKVIVVNKGALRAVGLLPPEHQERQIADQYRQIKRPLIAAALHKGSDALRNAQFIMVSSALPGDGKTFTSINLSISISREKDLHVLLIDADVAKPHISQLLGVAQQPGLLDALHDPSIDIESLILPTDIPGLSVLPAGRRSETATELLASQRMETLVDTLESMTRRGLWSSIRRHCCSPASHARSPSGSVRSSSLCVRARPCNRTCSTR